MSISSSPGMPQRHSSPIITGTVTQRVSPISLSLSNFSSASAALAADTRFSVPSDNSPQVISVDTPNLLSLSSDRAALAADTQSSISSDGSPQAISVDTPSTHVLEPSCLTAELSSLDTNSPSPLTAASNLRVCVVNCNSARNKKAVFTNFLDYAKPDLALITETKLDSNIVYNEFLPEGYHGKIRKDRNSAGGGVMIAARHDLDIVEIDILNNNAESVWAKVLIENQPPLVIGAAYRQDTMSSIEQIDHFDSNIDFIYDSLGHDTNFTLMIGGDFNLPDIDWDMSVVPHGSARVGISNRFLEMASKHSLHQMVTIPTRNENILDLFLINKPGLVKEVSTIPGISPNDHDIVVVDMFISIKPNKKPKRKIYLWSKADWDFIKTKVLEFQKEFFDLSLDSAEGYYSSFSNFVEKIIKDHVPTKFSTNRNRVPWMSATIRRLCRKKQRAYNKARKSKSPSAWKSFRSIQKQVIKNLKSARENYINNILADSLKNKDTKPFWRYVKSQRQDNCGVAPLKSPTSGELFSDSLSKAKILNKQFCSVFTSDQEDPYSDSTLHGPPLPSIDTISFEVKGVEKLLNNLNPKKSQWP